MALLSSATVSALGAAEPRSRPLLEESQFFEPIPVVMSATRLQQPIDETPAAITVIDRQMIELSGALDVVDLLRLVPGFQVAQTTGNLFTVSSHGTGAPWFSRIQVLIDGHSVYHTAFSGLDWAQLGLPLANIERIEVVRGPNIVTYGANAVQGTVNIITRRPFEQQGAFLEATAGEAGRRDLVARWADQFDELDYRVTYSHRESDGFDDQRDDTDFDALSLHGTWNASARDVVALYADFTDSTMGENLGAIVFADPLPVTDRDVKTNSQVMRWTHGERIDDSWYLQFSRDHYDTREDLRVLASDWFELPSELIEPTLGFPDQPFSYNHFDGKSDRYDLEFQRTQTLAPEVRAVWGLGYRHDRFRHFLLDSAGLDTADTYRAFGNLEWRPSDDLVLNLGALGEDSSNSDVSTFSPRLGANYHIDGSQTLRAAISRAHKHPSLLEENWNNLLRLDDGTPIYRAAISAGGLDAEKRDVVELGYLGSWYAKRLSLDARLYHEDVDDAVLYALGLDCDQPLVAGTCYIVDNHMSYRVDGLELQAEYRPTPRTFARLHYAYADVDGEVPARLPPGLVLTDLEHTAPRHSGGLLLGHEFGKGWQASMAVYHADRTYWYIDGDLVDGYTRVDLRLAKRLDLDRARANLEFIVQNLGDDYSEFSDRNRFDTRAFVRFSVQFD